MRGRWVNGEGVVPWFGRLIVETTVWSALDIQYILPTCNYIMRLQILMTTNTKTERNYKQEKRTGKEKERRGRKRRKLPLRSRL